MTIPDFGDGPLDIIVRTAIVYGALIVLLRLAGKRQVGQLSILDLVTLLVISDAVQNAMVGENATLVGGLVAAATLVTLDRTLHWLRDRLPWFRKVVEGEPRLLIRHGLALRKALAEEGVELDELEKAVREHGLLRIDQVKLAVLETDGQISIIPEDDDDTTPNEPTERPGP